MLLNTFFSLVFKCRYNYYPINLTNKEMELILHNLKRSCKKVCVQNTNTIMKNKAIGCQLGRKICMNSKTNFAVELTEADFL